MADPEQADQETERQKTNTTVTLADDSSIKATEKGTRTVKWNTHEGDNHIKLSNTLVVPGISMSLLSVPSLVDKNIGVIFLPGKAVLIDLEDQNSILGYGTQDSDGLFYISDNQSDIPTFDDNTSNTVKACVSIVRDETVPEDVKRIK